MQNMAKKGCLSLAELQEMVWNYCFYLISLWLYHSNIYFSFSLTIYLPSLNIFLDCTWKKEKCMCYELNSDSWYFQRIFFALKHLSILIYHHFCILTLQHFSILAFQYFSISAFKNISISALRHFSISAFQGFSISAFQYLTLSLFQ